MALNGIHTPPKPTAEYIGKSGLLFQADVLDLLANIKDNTIDLAFVDPPFNLSKDYGVPDLRDTMATELYRGWCRTWILELIRVLRPGGSLFIYHMPIWLMDFGAWLNNSNLVEYKSWIAVKMKSGFPPKGRIYPAHYGLLYYVKLDGRVTFNVVRTKSPTCRNCHKLIRDYGGYKSLYQFRDEQDAEIPWVQVSDFWEDTRPARQEKSRDTKVNELPLLIPERVILMASDPGDVVLDCFVGGGSTLHAANLHDRVWIGGDIGKPISALKRIGAFLGVEYSQPSPALLKCFQSAFVRQVITAYSCRRNHEALAAGYRHRGADFEKRYAIKSRVFDG